MVAKKLKKNPINPKANLRAEGSREVYFCLKMISILAIK